jgi:hypothetical protein
MAVHCRSQHGVRGQDVIDLTDGRQTNCHRHAGIGCQSRQNIEPFLVPTKISISSLLATYNKIARRGRQNCHCAVVLRPVKRTNPVQP